MKILFICEGNVGRSQIAEAIFNNVSKGKYIATSAGTKVINEDSNNEGQKIKDKDLNVVEVVKEIGIDISENVRKQLTPKVFNEADKVIVINPSENIPEYIKTNKKVTYWEIADPFNKPIEFTKQIRNQLQISVSNFIKTLD
jgi:protein-tyrosine-phosphatase